jgi:hypothetical protein
VNEALQPIGLGVYHTGVSIGGSEWTFAGGAGIFSHEPREPGGNEARFREAVDMGIDVTHFPIRICVFAGRLLPHSLLPTTHSTFSCLASKRCHFSIFGLSLSLQACLKVDKQH